MPNRVTVSRSPFGSYTVTGWTHSSPRPDSEVYELQPSQRPYLPGVYNYTTVTATVCKPPKPRTRFDIIEEFDLD